VQNLHLTLSITFVCTPVKKVAGILTSLYYRLLLAERYMLIIVMFGVYGKISTQMDH